MNPSIQHFFVLCEREMRQRAKPFSYPFLTRRACRTFFLFTVTIKIGAPNCYIVVYYYFLPAIISFSVMALLSNITAVIIITQKRYLYLCTHEERRKNIKKWKDSEKEEKRITRKGRGYKKDGNDKGKRKLQTTPPTYQSLEEAKTPRQVDIVPTLLEMSVRWRNVCIMGIFWLLRFLSMKEHIHLIIGKESCWRRVALRVKTHF